MVDMFIKHVKEMQVLLAGLIGFSGVIATMIANATIQRKNIERTIAHEKMALRSALKTELIQNMKAYQFRIEQLAEHSRFNSTIIPSVVRDDVYREHLSKIGLLTELEIEKVLNAYQIIEELPYRLKLLVVHEKTGEVSDEFIRIDHKHNPTMLKMHESFLPIIEDAISALNVNA